MFKRFNNKLGEKLSDWLSTMAMFYGICFLVIAPLLFQRPDSLVGWLQYVVSVFFQGVALPLLGYTSKIAEDKQAKLLQETHDTVMQEISVLNQIIKEIHEHTKII